MFCYFSIKIYESTICDVELFTRSNEAQKSYRKFGIICRKQIYNLTTQNSGTMKFSAPFFRQQKLKLAPNFSD